MDPTAWLAQLTVEIDEENTEIAKIEVELKERKAEQARRRNLSLELMELKRKYAIPNIKRVATKSAAEDGIPMGGDLLEVILASETPATGYARVEPTLATYIRKGFSHGLKASLTSLPNDLKRTLLPTLFETSIACSNVKACEEILNVGEPRRWAIPTAQLITNMDSKDPKVRAKTYETMHLMLRHGMSIGADLIGRVLDPDMKEVLTLAHDINK